MLNQLLALQGSRDNMSLVMIAFPAAQKVLPEAVKIEKEFEEEIRKKTREILEEHPEAEASRILALLNRDQQDLKIPPKSYLGSK